MPLSDQQQNIPRQQEQRHAKKKIKLAYEESSEAATPVKKNKRRERRERDAKVRAGELALPTPVIEFDKAKKLQLKTVRRCGIELYVRRPPYQSQLQVIDCALRAMNCARSAFLESPTGTGKTAAGLAAALAWQRENASTVPTRVVWVARTHDQLQHAVEEYRRSCAERPLMSLRLSRERFCLHPDIAVAPNKAEACEEATKVEGGSTFRNSGCGHLDKAESIGYPQSRSWRKHFLVGGKMNTWNIEDAVAEGNKLTVCPFHMAQDQIQQGAALIFITYQQLVEPIIRRAGGLDQVIEDAIVVVDEAHNLPQVARDAASLDLTETRLEQIIQTLVDFLPQIQTKHKEAHDMLASLVVSSSDDTQPLPKKKKKKLRFEMTTNGGPLVSLLHWLRHSARTFAPLPDPTENTKDELVWGGEAATMLARDVLGLVSADRIDENCKILWKLRKTLIEEGLESGAVRSDTINDLEAILVKLRYVLEPNAAKHYRLVVLKERKQINQEKTLRFVCLSGAVAMHTLTRGQRAPGLGKAEFLRPARSLLLMSGTLRPMDLLATELGFEQVPDTQQTVPENPPPSPPQSGEGEEDKKPLSMAFQASSVAACHLTSVVKGSLLPLRLDEACGGVALDASYKHSTQAPESREARDYFDALARALLGVASAAPNGMLVFFKSYKLLHLALERWTTTDSKSALLRVKPMFVEESGLTGEDFDARLVEYRAAAKTSKGAMLLAVMRGRAAEGADFKDEAARVVCVVGVPYPPRFDVATRLKLEHESHSHGKTCGIDAGERWYKAEAYRNVNQAAGRLIRHKHDYGALVLLDKALTKHPFMSDWYANRLETLSGATELHNRLKAFFAKRGVVAT